MKKRIASNKSKKTRLFKFSYLMLSGLLSCFIGIILVPIILTSTKKDTPFKPIKDGAIDVCNLENLKIEPEIKNNIIEFKSQPIDLINSFKISKVKSSTAKDFDNIFKYKLTPYFKGSNINQEFKNTMFNEPKNKIEFIQKLLKIKSINDSQLNEEVNKIVSSLETTKKRYEDYDTNIKKLDQIIKNNPDKDFKNVNVSENILNPFKGVYTNVNVKSTQQFEIDITDFILNYKNDNLTNLEKFLELIDHFTFDAIYANIDNNNQLEYYKFDNLILKSYFDKVNQLISITPNLNKLKIKQFKFLISIDVKNNIIQNLLFKPKLITEKYNGD
ncbi:hypothetical protein KQ875_01385 [Mycoplasma zalophi]|uniref:Uncharacterized protein n=1 Tax=Mycoplasma zalophi TaxID=191287 RepID=A0ABS6DQN7_9MOLU|nr:hypothetical protein [Mycoplasma zalophi]MBU4692247.1 hypothetical protein [Mycoplasma zalophi]